MAKLYVLTGPSGTGKGTVLSKLLEEDKNIFFSISATTRKPRTGEEHGKHYYFISHDQFEDEIKKGSFLEYAKYADNYYGTMQKYIDEKLDKGYDVILEIEVQGAMQVKEKFDEAIMVFIAPPSFEELERRLRGRATDSEDTILKRLEISKHELEKAKDFDYIIVNEDVEKSKNDIKKIIENMR